MINVDYAGITTGLKTFVKKPQLVRRDSTMTSFDLRKVNIYHFIKNITFLS